MTRLISLFLSILILSLPLQAADTLLVRQQQIPILIERQDNVWMEMRLEAERIRALESVTLSLSADTPPEAIRAIKLYYGGTEARTEADKGRWAPVDYVSAFRVGGTLRANPSYAILLAETCPSEATGRNLTLEAGGKALFPGVNFFWISIEMNPEKTTLETKVKAELSAARADGQALPVRSTTPPLTRRMAVGVRHAGDDGVAAYRIPGLVTTPKGTLLATYDVRRNSSVDLQEHIDIGLSRSTDGGRTWEPMRLPIAMGEAGGLPAAQNGTGDPCILVDEQTGDVLIIAAWAHGMGNRRAWHNSGPGMDETQTAQLLLTRSTDDGRTWSEPVNLTPQVKRPEWHFLLQGPGRGTCMADGTLVCPIQFIDPDRLPHAGIMYSRDHGTTWTLHNPARENTTEAQVAEPEPGVLMLNMRDNRGGSRAVSTTTDLGRTWQEHPSSRSALIEPVCMASLLSIRADENAAGRDLLLFSNPRSTDERHNLTLRLSTDGGLTWPDIHSLLLDAGSGWGYSCLTLVDPHTIGILYESSVAHITFQTIDLSELLTE